MTGFGTATLLTRRMITDSSVQEESKRISFIPSSSAWAKHDVDEESLASTATSSHDRSDSFADETKPLSFQSSGEALETETNEVPKTATWTTAGLLMIADVVGAGVMGLATAFAQLGWVLGFCSLVFWYFVNMYVGVLIGEAKEAWPKIESFMDLSHATFGKRSRIFTGMAVYTFIAFVLGNYMLIMGETFYMMFPKEWHLCSWQNTAIALVLLIPLMCVRLLALTNKLMMLNIFTILGSIFIALGRLGTMDNDEIKAYYGNSTEIRKTEAFASDLTILSFFHSQALFAFAYVGVFIYLEIISEMKEPKDFRKSLLWLSGPFQFVIYAVTAGLGYALIGNNANGLLIKQIPPGTAAKISAFCLAIHMVLSFMVKGTVLARAIHGYASPSTAKDFSSKKARTIYYAIYFSILFFCFMVANLIPFFDDLTAFLGALQTPIIGFIMPIFYALKARKKLNRPTGGAEMKFMWFIIAWMILLFFVGVTSSWTNIVDKWKSYGKPFQC